MDELPGALPGPSRASIVNRPLKKSPETAGSWTKTTVESQWADEQALQEARRRKQESSQARLMASLYPTREGKHQRQEELKRQGDAYLVARELERQRIASSDAAWQATSAAAAASRTAYGAAVPCWSANLIGPTLEEQAEERRKAMAMQARAENERLIAERHLRKAAEAREAAEKERKELAAESSFFTLGAASDRWIAPEHRMLHAPRPQSAAAAHRPHPPWALDDD